MSNRTIILGRYIGLLFLIVAGAILFFPTAVVNAASTILHNATLVHVLGALTLIAGLAIVILHSRWFGGFVPLAITLFGWLAAIKGAALLLVAPEVWSSLLDQVAFGQFYLGYATVALLLGIWLSFSTFHERSS